MTTPATTRSSVEFITLMALTFSLIAMSIDGVLAANRSFPLFEYVRRLGLTDRLWYPEAIRRGRIDAAPDDENGPARFMGALGVRLSYFKLLPADVAPVVMQAAR